MHVGKFSTSKKSALRKCASRSALRVSTDAIWTVTSTDDCVTGEPTTTVPATSAKLPRTWSP